MIEPEKEAQEDEAQDERPTISANNVITNARKEAHPGDPRRVMGSNDDPVRSNLQAMLHQLTSVNDDSEEDNDSDFEGYWEETDFTRAFGKCLIPMQPFSTTQRQDEWKRDNRSTSNGVVFRRK